VLLDLKIATLRVVRTLDAFKYVSCPQCGGDLKLRKTSHAFSKSVDDANGQTFQTIDRFFNCSRCDFRQKSTEWRPEPKKPCCVAALKNSRVYLAQVIAVDNHLLWNRERSTICVCGTSYAWNERMVIGRER